MAIQLSSDTTVIGQSAFSSSSTQYHRLGQKAVDNRGGTYRYCLAGGTSLVVGKLQQAAAEVTADQNLTAVAAAIGDTSIAASSTVTWTANQYGEGWAIITVTPGVGYMYPVKSHTAYTAAAPTIQLDEPVVVALTTSSRIDMVQNPYSGIIVNPTSATSAPVGACIYVITNAQYGWIKTGGVAALLADGSVTVGTSLDASNGTAGAVEAHAEAGVQAPVAFALTGIATTEYGACKLLLE